MNALTYVLVGDKSTFCHLLVYHLLHFLMEHLGNSNGSIRVFGPDKNGEVEFLDRKLIHGAPVAAISSYKLNLASCDESGCTVLSKFDSGELVILARSKIFGGLVINTLLNNYYYHCAMYTALITDYDEMQIHV